MERRTLLAAIATGAGALAGCTDGLPAAAEAPTTEPTDDRTTDDGARITDGTPQPTGAVAGDRIELTNAAGSVLSFALRLRDDATGKRLYGDTYSFDPGESLELGEAYTGRTLVFRAARPDGTTVFERTVAPAERYELAIRSATEIEVTIHSVK